MRLDARPPRERRWLMARVWSAVSAHPVVAAVLAIAAAGFAVVNTLVGMPVVVTAALLVAVGLVAAALHRVRTSHRSAAGPQSTDRRAGPAPLVTVGLAVLIVALAIQVIPYGRSHSNPPVTGEPQWAAPAARELMVRACFSCHSTEVVYPAYASVAPISWAIEGHVAAGRDEVNYSEFATNRGEADHTVEVIVDGEMPPPFYTRFGRNPDAVLSFDEREMLIAWLRATPGLHEDDGDEDDADDQDDD